jgi:hypothetical protein
MSKKNHITFLTILWVIIMWYFTIKYKDCKYCEMKAQLNKINVNFACKFSYFFLIKIHFTFSGILSQWKFVFLRKITLTFSSSGRFQGHWTFFRYPIFIWENFPGTKYTIQMENRRATTKNNFVLFSLSFSSVCEWQFRNLMTFCCCF